MPSSNTFRAVQWNIDKGGFSRYDHTEDSPPKEEAILDVLDNIPKDTLTLVDAFRWNTQYGGDAGIASHLGMESAFFTPLGDDEMIRGNPNAAEMGIVFATDLPVEGHPDVVDLGTRQASSVVLKIGSYGVRMISAYLHHESEDMRNLQMSALMSYIAREENIPTVMTCDFNGLRPLEHACRSEKIRSLLARTAIRVFPFVDPAIAKTMRELERREVMRQAFDNGFPDSDPRQQPTALGRLQVFGVDYILGNKRAPVSDVTVHPHRNASDHRVLSGTVTYPSN